MAFLQLSCLISPPPGVSEKPKPSVPSDVKLPRTHWAIWSGTARRKSLTATSRPGWRRSCRARPRPRPADAPSPWTTPPSRSCAGTATANTPNSPPSAPATPASPPTSADARSAPTGSRSIRAPRRQRPATRPPTRLAPRRRQSRSAGRRRPQRGPGPARPFLHRAHRRHLITVAAEVARTSAENVARLVLNAARYATGVTPAAQANQPTDQISGRPPSAQVPPMKKHTRTGHTTAPPCPHHENHNAPRRRNSRSGVVGRPGLEPGTYGLKVHSSAN